MPKLFFVFFDSPESDEDDEWTMEQREIEKLQQKLDEDLDEDDFLIPELPKEVS